MSEKDYKALYENLENVVEVATNFLKTETRERRFNEVMGECRKFNENDKSLMDGVIDELIDDYCRISNKTSIEVKNNLCISDYIQLRDQALYELATLHDIEKFRTYKSHLSASKE